MVKGQKNPNSIFLQLRWTRLRGITDHHTHTLSHDINIIHIYDYIQIIHVYRQHVQS